MCSLAVSALGRVSCHTEASLPRVVLPTDHASSSASPTTACCTQGPAQRRTKLSCLSCSHLRQLSSGFRYSYSTDSGIGATTVGRVRRQVSLRAQEDESESKASGKKEAVMEKSAAVNEELLLFFFQLDLNTRLQRALNQDQYDVAKQIREKITEVELEVTRLREVKMGASSKDEAQEKGLIMLRIKSELQKAIEEENYKEAAALRDQISKLEADALAASLKGLAASNAKYQFRLGQKIRHREFDYRGIVCGMDPVCCESEEWGKSAQVDGLSRGRNQPFYQVLLDLGDVENFNFTVAYVAEENLVEPEEPDKEAFSHPYLYLLFFGVDGNGDYIPTKQLRDKYNAARHEIPYDESSDDADSKNDDS